MKKELQLNQWNPKIRKQEQAGKLILDRTPENRAELYFYGDIVSDSWGKWQWEDRCPQDISDFLREIQGASALDIYLNSGGGSVSAGIAIYHELRRFQGEKISHIDGLAASIASVIALAGDRVIMPAGAQLMIHKPWTALDGNADELRKAADYLDKAEQAILDIYLQHAKEGVTGEQLGRLMAEETWFSGAEAANYFQIEVEAGREAAACADSSYFSHYRKTPQSLNLAGQIPETTREQQFLLLQMQLNTL